MEATKEIVANVDTLTAEVDQELSAAGLRELSSMELMLVGGGAGVAVFL